MGAVAGLDTATTGAHYFDAFESRRQTYIGSGTTLPEAIFANDFESGNLCADVDGDGFITGDDFTLFVIAFEIGC